MNKTGFDDLTKFSSILIALTLSTAGSAWAQISDAQTWQPGQVITPQFQSDPHNDVQKMLRQNKLPQALVLVEQTLTKNPRDPQMLFWKAFIFDKQGHTDAALGIYLSLTQEFPELPEPFNNLGVIYAAQADYSKAQAAFEAAIRDNPSYSIALENLGDVLLHLAKQSYERALSQDPKQSGPARKIELLAPSLNLTVGKRP